MIKAENLLDFYKCFSDGVKNNKILDHTTSNK